MITPALGVPAVRADGPIDFPHGTVSAYVDEEKGVLRIFAEPEPHEEDWLIARELASMAGGGWTLLGDSEIDVFIIEIVPDAMSVVA